MAPVNCFVHAPPTLRSRMVPTEVCTLSIDARRSRYLARPRPQVRCLHPRVRMTHPAHPGARPFFLSALRAAGRAIMTTPRSSMAFAAAEQGHNDVPQAGLRHQEQRVVSSTACLQSRVSAAALGSAELHARIARMAWLHRSCCQANEGRSWPSSQRFFAQRMPCMLSGAVSKDGNVLSVASYGAVRLSVSSRALFVLMARMADEVKNVDFSNTVPSSRPRHTDRGTLRGSASFALSHEKVWSKVNWLLD